MIKLTGYLPFRNIVPGVVSFSEKAAGFTKLAGSSTGSEHIIPEFTPVSDQGQANDCVANSVADSVEILKGLESPNNVVQVSRLFIYFNARSKINATNQDAGCYIHDAMASLKTLGVCRESTWSYDLTKVMVHPDLESYREASSNKITDFYQITSSGQQRISDVENSIRSNHPVAFGTIIGGEIMNYSGDPNTVIGITSSPEGGHAMIVTGVRINVSGHREFLIRNSWGSSYGIQNQYGGGHFWVSEVFIADNQTSDLFVPTHMIDFLL